MSAIPLRPLDFGEVLDLGFGLFRRDYRLYMPLALVGLVPAMVATVIPTASEIDADVILADPGAVLPFFGLMAVGMVFSLLTWGALAAAMDNLMGDRPASIGSSYARALAALPRLVAAGALALAVLGAAIFALAFPMVALVAFAGPAASLAGALISSFVILAMAAAVVGWWATHVFMLVPATVVEGRGPFAGLRRSFGLVRGSRMRTFFVVVVTWFITAMPGVAAYALAGSAGDLFAANPAQTIGLVRFWVIQIVGLGFQSVTTPLMMACAMVLFTDLKTRSEGTDLEAAARAMAG
ncbi:MAG: hypothetical protein OXH08_02870 [Gammaproteobacteria bacterium]|nr:hypothetical protein [Gammaproteobacteria bacterium]MDE0651499.1 hypothetical protein [Gammaproteobacteria bacterium]